ncbi:MAG: MobF family relaxase [Planctomycetota bacterium]
MLSIKPIGASSRELSYYSALGTAEGHDYYTEDGDRCGVWFGSGTQALGLAGNVDQSTFKNLLDGLSADASSFLVRSRKSGQTNRRAGFDLTFSVPKSFSIAWSVADRATRNEMDRRARIALYRSLEAVEEYCGRTRRGRNGVRQERGKLAFAVFSHDTARGVDGQPPDPNRHFHAVLINAAVRQDGTTGALDARPLFFKRMKMALGAMFRAELSKQLSEMGFETIRPKRERSDERVSWFELGCVPKELISAMSKRRAAIETWLRKRGLSGAKSSELAALRTRRNKDAYSQKKLFKIWGSTVTAYGFTHSKLASSIERGPIERTNAMDEVIRLSVRGIVEKRARFSTIELLERIAVECQCRGLGIEEIRHGLESYLSTSSELVKLRDDSCGVKTFTTRSMLAIEKRMLETARILRDRSILALRPETVNDALSQFPSLRAEQIEAIRYMTAGSNIACVNGVAGSGKTFMLRVANECWQSAGYRVIGTALSAKASRGLEEGSGIFSSHIHQLVKQLELRDVELGPRTILVVDEAGMVGTQLTAQLLSAVADAGAKVVFVGDHKQLQAIDAGSAFRGIMEQVGHVELEEIIRQREKWSRGTVIDLRDGRAERALEELWNREQLYIGEDRDDAINQLVSDWACAAKTNPRETIALAGKTLEVRALNRLMQSVRLQRGELGSDKLHIDGFDIHLGDRVLVTRNHMPLCLQNGTIAEVLEIDEHSLLMRFDDGITIEVDTREFDKFTLGYAISTHRAQGVTVENAFVLSGDLSMTDRELSYVQGSRAKAFTKFYTDAVATGEGIDVLAELMNRTRPKELAIDHVMDGVV